MIRSKRFSTIHTALLLFALALIARAAQVQLWQGRAWAARAARQHFSAAPLPAPRGAILDATGMVLAEDREMVRVSVAPREVRDGARLARELARAGVPAPFIARARDRRRSWVPLPGKFLPSDIATLASLRGVYTEPVNDRVYALSDGMRELVGRVGSDGHGLDGMELALDSLLRGTAGSATMLRDVRGRTFESPVSPGVAPRPGATVVLTVNHALQEICERALADAVSRMGADGGDIVVLDPHDGEVLALASRRADGQSSAITGLTAPFEPGSTVKPLIAAALLQRGLARPTDVIETHGGVLTIAGRTIHDAEKTPPRATLADVIRYSSNVGIAQFAQRLTPRAEYEALRDFGFGTPTAVAYPSEASGVLREPAHWSLQSPASLAMGYELSVTAMQLATAYAAIANGGELLMPALVKEIRDADGTVLYRHAPRLVRRVIDPPVAAAVRKMLIGVVEQGTAVQADLANFAVAGKTGTARSAVPGQGYTASRYTASFVGLFPAEAPQYVILVKLDDPAGIYGGATAAPVTKAVLEAALAARDAALDRGALASRERHPAAADAAADSARLALRDAGDDAPTGSVPFVVALPAPRPLVRPAGAPRPVPDVHGLPLREAVFRLHRAGFRVRLGDGPAGSTWPAAGTVAPAGSTVRLADGP